MLAIHTNAKLIQNIKMQRLILLLSIFCMGMVNLNPHLVRPWNQKEKNQYPSPLSAVFKKDRKTLAFVGDRHADPVKTYLYLEKTFNEINPQIIVIEGLEFSKGESPSEYAELYRSKTISELYDDGWAAPLGAKLAMTKKIPFIGGEPARDEEVKHDFILNKGFTEMDIRGFRFLQRMPYRRDVLKKDVMPLPKSFFAWYEKHAGKKFDYSKIKKVDYDFNCEPDDNYFQKIGCAVNLNRDYMLVSNLNTLFKKYDRILVVYGTGHFVQEYPAFLQYFGEPKYFKFSEATGYPSK